MEQSKFADRIVELEYGNDENEKVAGGHPSVDNLLAAKQQKQRNCNGAENIHERGTDRCGSNRSQVGSEKALCCITKAREFPSFHTEGLHDAVAGDSLVKNVLDIRQLVLPTTRSTAHPPTNSPSRQNNEGHEQEQQPR